MASTTVAPNNSIQAFQPPIKPVVQSCDHDDAFACVAAICNKSLDEIRKVAIERFGHPRTGPYWIGEGLIVKLLAHYSWVATIYKTSTGIASLPDLAIGMVDYNPDTDIGRYVVFQRIPAGGSLKQPIEYVIDPAYWIDPPMRVRTEIKGFPISFYIGVHPMQKSVAKADK